MGEINDFGFKIYRLRMAQDNCEFLLYDTTNSVYYQYSYRRGKDILKQLIEKITKIELIDYMKKNDYLDEKGKGQDCMAIFNRWITEELEFIDNISYKPVDKLIFEEDGVLFFNLYRKSDLLKEDLKDYDTNFPMIKQLILNLIGDDEKAYTYFIKWLAWKIQNPLDRLATSIVFKGEQGSGKTLFTDYVLKPIFKTNFIEITQADIAADYNDYMLGKEIVIANEVIYNEKNVNSSQSIKKLVTDSHITVRQKYKSTIYSNNYAQFIFTSNARVPVGVERNDRRFSIFKSKKLHDGVLFFQEFVKIQDKELRSFLKYIREEVDVILGEVNYPYINQHRKEVIEASLNSVELFFESITDAGGIEELNKEYIENNDGWRLNIQMIQNSKSTYYKIESMYKLYQRFSIYSGIKNIFGRNGFTAMLRHMNYTLTIIKDEDDKSIRVMKLAGVEQ